jgi:hypothetical protein
VAQELAGPCPVKAQELVGQCLAKAPGRERAHQWDQVARECRGLEVPEHRGHAARAEQLGQAGPVEQLGWAAPVEHRGRAASVEHQEQEAREEGQVAVEHQGLAALEGDQAGTELQ